MTYYKPRRWIRHAAAHRRSRGREERIIDASVEETFPASDPSSSAQPGSIAAQSYAFARRRSAGSGWLVPVALGMLALAFVTAMRRRR